MDYIGFFVKSLVKFQTFEDISRSTCSVVTQVDIFKINFILTKIITNVVGVFENQEVSY